ncbi:MAG: RelA/SpoT domain-containing protein, partial [Gammaproteobacteria bacterium]|nr:RelA/SpoT domain-containing protein [Gammaproteobacteria bacterium]
MYINHEDALAKKLTEMIESELLRLGLLYRIFSRSKTIDSISKKIYNKGEGYYSPTGKKIQDAFGVRIALYFFDDLPVAQEILKKSFKLLSKEVNDFNNELFSAQRCNYIFKLPNDISRDSQIIQENPLIDDTFEVQFRTILSEGWHEVEHDLRYKCKTDWDGHDDLSRNLNGIYATLETADWGIMKLFEDLSYRHYKASEWGPMIRNKFRLRMDDDLREDILDVIECNSLGKKIFRLDRELVLGKILDLKLDFPININNIILI